MFLKKIRFFAVLGILLVLIFLSMFLLSNFLIHKPSVQNLIIKKISDATGFDIQTHKIDLSLWRGIGISVLGLEARSKQGPGSVVASEVIITLDAGQLVKGEIVPVRLYLFEPKIELAMKDEPISTEPDKKQLVKVPPVYWIPGIKSISMEKGQIQIKNRPYDLKDLYLDVHQESTAPITLRLSANGKVRFRGDRVYFSLFGSVSHNHGGEGPTSVDIDLETGKVPISWIPWPESMPVKGGDFETHLKIKGELQYPMSVNGKIITESPHFLLRRPDQNKDLSLPDMTIDFRSSIERRKINISSLQVRTPDVPISLRLKLDLKERANPYLELKAESPFMTLSTFKSLFPLHILSPWIENRLFPVLRNGDIRLKMLSLKGSVDQFKNLHLPENHSVIGARLECKNFEILGGGIQLPFKETSAEVILELGTLRVSGLRSNFGHSIIRDASLEMEEIFKGRTTYEALVDGSFDLHDLMRQREMDLLPSEVRNRLSQVEDVSGNLICNAWFRYEHEWESPRMTNGKLVFKDCLIEQRGLLFPLELKKGEIHIDEEDQNRFAGIGNWGDTTFKVKGAFGVMGNRYDLRGAELSAHVDMNQVISLFYEVDRLPMAFKGPVQCRISTKKKEDSWSFRGNVDLEGVGLESDHLSMDSLGRQDRIFFDLDFKPQDRIDLKKILFQLKGSSLELSGSYDLQNRDDLTLKVHSPGLSLEDLGIRFKKSDVTAQGTIKGDVALRVVPGNHLNTLVNGQIEGEDLSFSLKQIPSPISQCQFRVNFSGKKGVIDFWKMRIGQSQMDINGNLRGWDGLKGEIGVHSNFLDTADLLYDENSSFSRDKNPGMNRIPDNVDINLKLDILKGRWRRLKWGPLEADLGLREGKLHIKNSRMSLENGVIYVKGHVATGEEPDLYLSSHIRLTHQPIEELMESLRIKDEYLKGSLDLEALLFMKGKHKKDLIPNLSGFAHVEMKKGLIKRSHVLFNILNFLSLRKIFKHRPPDLSKEGFYFDSIEGDAVIDQGILETENFVMKSPVFNAVGSGKVDMIQRTTDFSLGTQPLGTIDTLVSNLPILGYILTGKGRSILTYYFKVNGPLFRPDVKYVPFKNLGRGVAGVLKRLFLTPFRILKKSSNHSDDPVGQDSPLPEESF